MKLPRTTTGKYSVEAVAKALDILETFIGAEELALTEICRRVGMSKSRTFRLLHTLEGRGYIERSAGGSRYQLGVKLFECAAKVRCDLKQLSRPFMRKLRERFNETVNLGVLNDAEVLYLDILETTRPFRMMAAVGCRMPAFQTAMGKAMFSHLEMNHPRSPIQALMGRLRPAQKRRMMRMLQTVAKRGYAIDDQGNEPGVACIGAAILDAAGDPVAAISVSGPAYRILAEKKNIGPAIQAACHSISQSLGFTASTPKRN